MIFVRSAADIGRLYFWNLTGSAAGGAAMTGLMWLFPPSALPGLAAVMALTAALLVLPEGLRGRLLPDGVGGPEDCRLAGDAGGRPFGDPAPRPGTGWRRVLVAAALLSGLAAALAVIRPPVPVLSEFKGLSRALHLPDARITAERSSPYGLMQVFASPALRYAPGLSLTWQEKIPVGKAVFNNGDWFGAVVPRQGGAGFLDYTTGALPYALESRRSVLILDAGSCSLVSQALDRGAERITAVEPHPVILSLLGGELAGETGDLLRHPAVSVRNLSSRTFLAQDRSQYDLILLPTLDAFGGTSGLHAVREDYLLTREAFRQIWRKLTPGGAISVTSWMDYPLRHPLKIVATLAEVLEAEGVADLRDHLAAVRGWGTITILAKKTPLNAADTANIRRFCRELRFDPALLPDLRAEERMRFNALQDERLFLYLDELLAPSRARFIADYAFNILPATDDRPYFSQFLRWRSIPELVRLYGGRTFPFLEAGYLLVLMTLLQVAVAAVVLILLPLRFLGPGGRSRLSTLLYFSGLGIGYMFVEIVLIQRFLLYLGNPLYAAAVVISGMLLSSGIGSLLTARLIKKRTHALALFTLIVLLILLYARFLTPLLLVHHRPAAGRAGGPRPPDHRPRGFCYGHALSPGHPPPDGNGRGGDPLGLGDQRLPLRGEHAPGHGHRRGDGVCPGDDPCGPRLRHDLSSGGWRDCSGRRPSGDCPGDRHLIRLDNRTMVLYAEAMEEKRTAMRRILHIDMDAFFAAVEQQRRPELSGKPVVIGGQGDPSRRGVVSTANYEARKFRVHSGMPLRTAYKLCPQAVYPPRRL